MTDEIDRDEWQPAAEAAAVVDALVAAIRRDAGLKGARRLRPGAAQMLLLLQGLLMPPRKAGDKAATGPIDFTTKAGAGLLRVYASWFAMKFSYTFQRGYDVGSTVELGTYAALARIWPAERLRDYILQRATEIVPAPEVAEEVALAKAAE